MPPLPGPAAGDLEEQQGTDVDEFPAHIALCRDDTLPVTRSVKLQPSGAVPVSVSRKARSSSVGGGAPYVYSMVFSTHVEFNKIRFFIL